MNFFKRAFLSLKHKIGANVMLVILFTALGTLILCGFAIRSGSINSCVAVRRALGGTVQMTSANATDGIPLTVAEKFAKDKYVKYSNFCQTADGYAVDFQGSALIPKGKEVKNVYIYGITDATLISHFKNGNYKLKSGRLITADDLNKDNALIGSKLAELNKLKTGSKITVAAFGGKKIEFTVVGIYEDTKENPSAGDETFYVPYTCALNIANLDKISLAFYEIEDPINIDAFVNEINTQYPNQYTPYAQDGDYKRISGSLVSIGTIANILLIISIIASAAILFLIVMLTFKSRNYEIGILLSIGEKKRKIISQMAVEILVPVLIAFGISAACGKLTTAGIGNMMVDMQQSIATSDEIHITSSNDTLSSDTQTDRSALEKVNAAEDSASLKVEVIPEEYLYLFLAAILISLIATIVPVVAVMQYSPKQIFSQLE